MAARRAIYAARFLRPPGYTKRIVLREKPRDLTGPYENPVRRWVRLREKARLFAELPPPRKIPVPKPSRRTPLQAVEGVPRVSPEVLQRRLDFLLSPIAIEQQLSATLLPGLTPFEVEDLCWQRQMREVRRIYRAQYLQKLAEVTEIERHNEADLHARALEERRRRKQAHLQRIGEDMKRRAILADRKRIEEKVNEAMEMARRSKIKRRRLYWFRRMENLSKIIVSAENFEEVWKGVGPGPSNTAEQPALPSSGLTSTAASTVSSSALLSRNVSVPFLLRQLGGATGFPKQKARRIPFGDNVQRDVLESSYDILPEDSPRFEPPPEEAAALAGASSLPSERERAKQLYSSFSEEEKLTLLNTKIEMLEQKMKKNDQLGRLDNITPRLLDELDAARTAISEGPTAARLKARAREARGEDVPDPLAGSSRLGPGSRRGSGDSDR